jgi:16S rRNA (guanine527-N7)-methyltransferase
VSKKGQEAFDLEADKAHALKLVPVSRDTEKRLDAFIVLLLHWQRHLNLIAPSTVPTIWTRHVADSLQLMRHANGATVWADFGAGGGFPGIPLACALTEQGGMVHLIESNGKKVAFLREAVRATGASAKVHQVRAEEFAETCAEPIQIVTARALAPLKTIFDQVLPLVVRGAIGLFPKGQHVDAELTEAAKYWTMDAFKFPSVTRPGSCIVAVYSLVRREPA